MGRSSIIAVYEKAADARAALRETTIYEAGRYVVTVRPLQAAQPADRLAAWH